MKKIDVKNFGKVAGISYEELVLQILETSFEVKQIK